MGNRHKQEKPKRVCQICQKNSSSVELVPAAIIRPAITNLIKQRFPQWSEDGFICTTDLTRFRYDYFYSLLETERGEITSLEEEVLDSLKSHELLSSDVSKQYESDLTFGERLSDHIADFGGSWKFIIIFSLTMLLWISVNTFLILKRPFDPYPYILLNLVLSCLAAMQAPIIMMSQNRQESRDRLHAENDYKTNLKAELEIRQLHQKMDHLLTHQWERMVEIQEIQISLIEELRKPRFSQDAD